MHKWIYDASSWWLNDALFHCERSGPAVRQLIFNTCFFSPFVSFVTLNLTNLWDCVFVLWFTQKIERKKNGRVSNILSQWDSCFWIHSYMNEWNCWIISSNNGLAKQGGYTKAGKGSLPPCRISLSTTPGLVPDMCSKLALLFPLHCLCANYFSWIPRHHFLIAVVSLIFI